MLLYSFLVDFFSFKLGCEYLEHNADFIERFVVHLVGCKPELFAIFTPNKPILGFFVRVGVPNEYCI